MLGNSYARNQLHLLNCLGTMYLRIQENFNFQTFSRRMKQVLNMKYQLNVSNQSEFVVINSSGNGA